MRIALEWLEKRLGQQLDVDDVARCLTSMGIEVEHIEGCLKVIDSVVVAKVESVAPHPHADRLQVATVYNGQMRMEVVCGAPNCRPGIWVALALVGTRLPSGLEITPRLVRGVTSVGMLCALEELGYEDDSPGKICELPETATLGMPAMHWLNKPILELSLTPDLGHALSIEGVASALAAGLCLPILPPSLALLAPDLEERPGRQINVRASAQQAVQEYATMVFEGVKVGPSPDWLRQELEKAQWRSVNNWVDLSNWLMLLTGRPIHLFDDHTLQGDLELRHGIEGEAITLIDGRRCILTREALVVADANGPVALAGIMGSRDHEVTESTTRILMEVALFDPRTIRRSVRTTCISSEASRRFERGVPLEDCETIVQRLIGLLDASSFKQYGPLMRAVSYHPQTRLVELKQERLKTYLGDEWTIETAAALLRRTLIHVDYIADQALLRAHIPPARHDLAIEEDLIDELIKLIGSDRLFPKSLLAPTLTTPHDPRHHFLRDLRHQLVGLGLQEVQSLDMVPSALLDAQHMDPTARVTLLEAPSVDANVLRPHLLASLLPIALHNERQLPCDMAIFEIGSRYFKRGTTLHEEEVLGIVLNGCHVPARFDAPGAAFQYEDLMGIFEALFARLHLPPLVVNMGEGEELLEDLLKGWLHPKMELTWRCASGTKLARIGVLHPQLRHRYGIKGPCLYGECDLKVLMSLLPSQLSYAPLPIYPASTRDWTMTLPESFLHDQLLHAFDQLDTKQLHLEKVTLIDIWRSEVLGSDRKNVTLRLHYRCLDRTLSQEEVDNAHAHLQACVVPLLP